MPRHRFKVGQAVDFTPGRWGLPASSREYKVLKLLPFEGGDLLYRIKSAAETFERVAKESELTPLTGLL
jgi:hypothetical protein